MFEGSWSLANAVCKFFHLMKIGGGLIGLREPLVEARFTASCIHDFHVVTSVRLVLKAHHEWQTFRTICFSDTLAES
jgi:hypothetical protein